MSGKPKLLVTRPRPDAERTADHLVALDIEPVIAPLLEPRAIADPLPAPNAFTAIALTSLNAVRFFAARHPDPAFYQKPVFAVGPATAREAAALGFTDIAAAGGTLVELAALIAATHKGGAILHPGARDLSGDLGAALAPHAIPVTAVTLYAMDMAEAFPADVEAMLSGGEITGAVFFSRRTAEAFARLADSPDLALLKIRLACLCLSENCAAPLVARQFSRIALADDPSHDAMMALALAFTRDQIRA